MASQTIRLRPEQATPTTAKYTVGQNVVVDRRTEAGSNRPGGPGKIFQVDTEFGSVLYTVKYSLGGQEGKLSENLIQLAELIESRPKRFSLDGGERRKFVSHFLERRLVDTHGISFKFCFTEELEKLKADPRVQQLLRSADDRSIIEISHLQSELASLRSKIRTNAAEKKDSKIAVLNATKALEKERVMRQIDQERMMQEVLHLAEQAAAAAHESARVEYSEKSRLALKEHAAKQAAKSLTISALERDVTDATARYHILEAAVEGMLVDQATEQGLRHEEATAVLRKEA